MNIMELKGITKRFPGVLALDDVNIQVRKGEILGVIGENGAGKSTLMQIISGCYPYGTYEGQVEVEGKAQHFRSPRDSERAGIAMIYQELSVHLDMSATENIFLGDWIRRKNGLVNWKEMHRQTREILERLQLHIDPNEKLRNLTKAEQQMICIGHALRKNPKILILDEPTAALPQKEVDILFDTIRRLKESGITIILISHKMDEVFSICDRLTILRNGKTIASHMVGEVDFPQIVEEMIGHSLAVMYPKEPTPLGEELLRVENLTIRHPFNPRKNILENVSFTLRAGEILGLEGLVGSGRTELMCAIYGQGNVVDGKIFVRGQEVNIRSPKAALVNRIALITEDRRTDGFVGLLSIKKNITLSSLKKISRWGSICAAREREFVDRYMEQLKIKAPSSASRVENLSGGNQQKVVISKCLLTEPVILMMDEPTRGIDVGAKTEIYKIMCDQAKAGKGIIMTSSERAELLNMTDRMLVLSQGRIQGELTREEYDEKRIVTMAAH